MYPPNILITNFCNQNCNFCFANLEMSRKQTNREIPLQYFKQLLLRLKRSGTSFNTIKLLGGEPTLHSQFENIIELSLKHFSYVQVFTNGIFTQEKANFLKKFFPRIKLAFNLTTPGFLGNKKIHQLVLDYIKDFSSKTKITISITIDPDTDIKSLVKPIGMEIIKSVNLFRIGLANPIAREKNWYEFKNFRKIGRKLYTLVSHIRNINSRARFFLNCGFTHCMFTNSQYRYLKKNKTKIFGWGCFGKTSSFDINPDLTAFHCLPLSTQYRLSLSSNNLSQVNKQFILLQYKYWGNILVETCQKCKVYGHMPNKCPGPCIAFQINERGKNDQNQL